MYQEQQTFLGVLWQHTLQVPQLSSPLFCQEVDGMALVTMPILTPTGGCKKGLLGKKAKIKNKKVKELEISALPWKED